MSNLTCFKAYDIRGKLGNELNIDIAYRIGRAFGQLQGTNSQVVIGCDARESSPRLKQATVDGLMDAGVDVIDIGLTGTEEVYFATQDLNVDGGIEITASHNPINYNGMKIVGKNAQPIDAENELPMIQALAESQQFTYSPYKGSYSKHSHLTPYVEHLFTYITPKNFTPLKLVVNAGNGVAGHVIDAIERQFKALALPIEFIKLHHQPDPTFPNGIPNPLLPENRHVTSEAVKQYHADMGIAWDGDFDRCFLFDEKGKFVESYYIVGLLAEAFLRKHPQSKIIHDPRLTWNTIDTVTQNGGQPIMSKTGHVFIKQRMREEDAIYGGEMSAHHYFKQFAYCDSGMIPWLLVSELLCLRQQPLSSMVEQQCQAYPVSGEINQELSDPQASIAKVIEHYSPDALNIDDIDGISMEFTNWRFNLRCSNTEPLVRLNVESKGDVQLVQQQTQTILTLLNKA